MKRRAFLAGGVGAIAAATLPLPAFAETTLEAVVVPPLPARYMGIALNSGKAGEVISVMLEAGAYAFNVSHANCRATIISHRLEETTYAGEVLGADGRRLIS